MITPVVFLLILVLFLIEAALIWGAEIREAQRRARWARDTTVLHDWEKEGWA